VKCEDVTEAILLRHPMLKGVLSNPETGHLLQFLESEIMMRVLRECQKHNIVALPVFDCVAVKSSVQGTVNGIMRREFKAVAGLEVTVNRELPGEIDARDLYEIRSYGSCPPKSASPAHIIVEERPCCTCDLYLKRFSSSRKCPENMG
jgi:hypothetical protein